MAKYVDTKVWLTIDGGVEGWDVDELNRYIDKWNSSEFKMIRSLGYFFQWLSHERGYRIYGFNLLWKSRLDSLVHRIKK